MIGSTAKMGAGTNVQDRLIAPVSYTHLDVYKRQRLDSHLMEIDSQARQRVDNLMSELLETNPAPDKMADGMAWTPIG